MDNVTKYFRTHHLPWSEAVDDDDVVAKTPFTEVDEVVVTIKMDGECFISKTPILMYDGTKKFISSIKIGDIVAGECNGEIIPSFVTKTFFNGNTNDWCRVCFEDLSGKKYKTLICTSTHNFFVDGVYKPIHEVSIGNVLKHLKNNRVCHDIQKQIILGKLLGDGSFGKYGTMQYTHKLEHIEYSNYINTILGDVYSGSCIDKNYNSYSKKEKYKSWTKSCNTISLLKQLMIKNNKKIFPKELIEEISPLSLAILYMDDGNISYNKLPIMHISTCGFDLESCENIRKVFDIYGIKTTLTNSDGYFYIHISAHSVNDFCELICKYIPPVMQYKLPDLFKNKFELLDVNYKSFNEQELKDVRVKSIDFISGSRYTGKYDIETTTHNYFANGVLVHNCTSLYPSGRCHARSIDSGNHPSRDFVKAYWRDRAHLLPHGWRVCGENLYAKHSIHYEDLKAYLYVFSIWNEHNMCLSWDETVEWVEMLELVPVEVIYRGLYDETEIKKAFLPHKERHEGYVVRNANSFHYSDASKNLAKYVRKNHVQTNEHWMFQEIVPNKIIN